MTPQRFRLHNVGSMLGTFGVANLQADPNCVLAQLPDYGVWGLQDFPPGTYTETQRYQWAAQKQVPWLRRNRCWDTEDFTNTSSWSRSATVTATTGQADRLGGTRAIKIGPSASSGANYIRQQYFALSIGPNYRVTVEAKADGYSYLMLGLKNNVTVNLTNGAIVSGTAIVTSLGDGWYRVDTDHSDVVTATNYQLNIGIARESDGTWAAWSGDSTKGILVAFPAQTIGSTTYQAIGASWDATYAALAAAAGFNTGIWQDAGTNPVNTSGNATGAIVDASKGGLNALGPELVTNGALSSADGWILFTSGAGACTISSGKCYLTLQAGTDRAILRQTIPTVAGKVYFASIVSETISGTSYIGLGTVLGGTEILGLAAKNGINSIIFVALSSTTYFQFSAGALANSSASVDNVSVREIPGYTANQATAANRPLWTLDANAKPYLLGDNVNDAMPVTFPASFSSNASVYVTTDAGTTVTDGVTLNGSYAPLVAAKQYAHVIFKSGRPAYHEKLIRWLNAKAGL